MSFQLTFRAVPEPDGPLQVATVPWDSGVLGYPVYELRVDAAAPETIAAPLAAWVASLPPRFLAFSKVPLGTVAVHRVLAAHGFYPVETMIELHLPLTRFARLVANAPRGWRLRPAGPEDAPLLTALAATSFKADRYHQDPQIDSARADQRYASWVEDGLRRGERIYVYENAEKGDVGGFFHVRATDEKTVDLSLAALSPAHQRIGLGFLLYQEVLLDCQRAGYSVATTRISVANVDVLNLFARLGFVFHHPGLTFHLTPGAA